MDKGITFTHLATAWGILAGVGTLLFGYIVLKVQTMITKSEEKTQLKIDANKKECDYKLKELDNAQDDKHTTIITKLEDLVNALNGVKVDIATIKARPHTTRSEDE